MPDAPAPIAVTLVGHLDDVLVDAFAEVAKRLASEGPRPLMLDVSDLIATAGGAFDRIVRLVATLRDAGIAVSVDTGSSGWRRLLAGAGIETAPTAPELRARARRRYIIARSGDHAA